MEKIQGKAKLPLTWLATTMAGEKKRGIGLCYEDMLQRPMLMFCSRDNNI